MIEAKREMKRGRGELVDIVAILPPVTSLVIVVETGEQNNKLLSLLKKQRDILK